MEIDYSAWRFWFSVLQWIITLGVALYVAVDRVRNDHRTVISETKKDIDGISKRVTRVEEALAHMPTHEDVSQLRSEMSAVKAQMETATMTLRRIEDYLLNKK
ncbi:DUF2730 family protein [Nitrincola iocasae]|nr:DUF2730 family protein [Nitrincola iocasae]